LSKYVSICYKHVFGVLAEGLRGVYLLSCYLR
jgi:hypothetical protein